MRCDCCDRELIRGSCLYKIRDNEKILYLHEECVPVFAGGWGSKDVEDKCGVESINCIFMMDNGAILYLSPWLSLEYVIRTVRENIHTPHLHREDGPAVIFDNKDITSFYWLRGNSYGKDRAAWKKEVKRLNNER